MPNYRSKNKGRRNKNRNKSSNQNRNKQEQQQQDQIKPKEDATQPNDEELLQHQEYYQRQIGCIPNMLSEDRSSKHYDSITGRRTPSTTEAHTVRKHPSGLPSSERIELKTSAGAKSNVSAGTVSGDSTKQESDDSPINVRTLGDGKNHSLSSEMGASSSKEGPHPLDHASFSPHSAEVFLAPQQGKVVVHRLIKQDTTMKDDEEISTQLNESDSRISKHTKQMQQATPSPTTCNSADFVMIINSNPTETPDNNGSTDQEAGFIGHNILSQRYHEDSPQTSSRDDHICSEIRKRKWCSLNDEEVPQVHRIAGSSLLGNEAEFDLIVDDGPVPEPTKPNKESYKQRRAEKRAAIETHFLPQFLSPRYLDSIMEENSDMSDARSEKSDGTLSRSASGNFGDESNDQHYTKAQKASETFPRSNLDFAKTHKHGSVPKVPTLPTSIREETSPSIVETKTIEQPAAADGCAIWSSIQNPESEVAEIVYINSASSSVSDLMELDYEENMATKRLISNVDLDTDVLEMLGQSTKPNLEPVVVETEKCKVHNDQLLSAVDLKALAADTTYVKTKSKITAITSTSTPTEITKITNEQAMKQCTTSEQLREAHRLNTSSVPSALASGSDKEGSLSTTEHKHIAENYSSTASDSDGSSRSPVSSISNVNTIVPFSGLIPKAQMNDIREILHDAAKESGGNASHRNKLPPISPHRESPSQPIECVHSSCGLPTPTSPSPKFSPTAENVTSADISTAEAVATSNFQNHTDTPHTTQRPLADAPNTNSFLVRQDSAGSCCSGSTSSCQSHCTAIDTLCGSLLPHYCTNSDVEPSVSGNISVPTTAAESAHLNAVIAAPTNGSTNSNDISSSAIKKLRLLCTETLASLPYGDEILEELASVAQNIGEIRATHRVQKSNDMPYPLPALPHISDIQVSVNKDPRKSTHLDPGHMLPCSSKSEFSSSPPPVPQPPRAFNCWLGVPTESDPKLLICLSPSQRSLMEDAKVAGGHKPDHLLDAHKKFIERRGYHEYTAEQVNAMNLEKAAEHKLIETTSMMKQLRKSLTPPPSVPPPPIQRKCFDENSRIQNPRKTPQAVKNYTGSCGNTREQRSLFDGNEENKHRLLAIIHDDTNEIKQDQSSDENNSRPTSKIAKQTQFEQEKMEPQELLSTPHTHKNEKNASVSEQLKHYASNVLSSTDSGHSALSSSQAKSSVSSASPSAVPQSEEGNCARKFPKSDSFAHEMKSIDSKFSQSPAMGYMDNLDSVQKRFSNVETSCRSEVISLRPKRYSNVETSSYESEKCIENGRVVYDTNNSTHESVTQGKFNSIPHFPVKDLSRSEWSHTSGSKSNSEKQTSFATTVKISPNLKVKSNADEIMSALILNTPVAVGKTAAPTSGGAASVCASSDSKMEERETERESHEKIEMSKNKEGSDSTLHEHITTSKEHRENEHFRQRAKAEEEEPLSEATSNNRKPNTTFHFDHEKLFKDFDDLSLQLNKELESGKIQKEQRERSASLYDLSRLQTESKTRFEELKNGRLEHMQELEHEIERSLLARRFKKLKEPENIACQPDNEQDRTQPKPLTFEIPIRIETDNSCPAPASSLVENNDSRKNDSLHQRAESMFDLSGNNTSQYRQRTASTGQALSNFANDWMRYADDLGSSENITRPFAREVEICYQRSRPHVIRAPRLTASTHDLSINNNYDSNNAYNVRRTHAPMLNQEPKKGDSRYLSCHSMIERDPNPTYISTTSRPAASPAPPTQHHVTQSKVTQHRRASLPREIHEQQLSYIANKEEELKTEFERLEIERRRLLEEMNRAPPVPMHMTRNAREAYRPAPNLPTLSEDEVFRQQMAEEWLSKIAEREERRLQKIIKVSKISEEKRSVLRHFQHQTRTATRLQIVNNLQQQQQVHHPKHYCDYHRHQRTLQRRPIDASIAQRHRRMYLTHPDVVKFTATNSSTGHSSSTRSTTKQQLDLPPAPAKRCKQTHSLLHRRSWSESDLLREIDNELKLAKGFLYADENNSTILPEPQSPVMFAPKFKAKAPLGGGIWTPNNHTPSSSRTNINEISGSTQSLAKQTPPPSPAQTTNAIWTPQPSPTTARKAFRPLRFESPTLTRRYIVQPEVAIASPQPPWAQATAAHNRNDSQYGNFTLSTPLQSAKLSTSLETRNGIISSSNCDEMASSVECVAPTASVSERIRTFERSASASELQHPVARRRPKDIPLIYRAKDVIYNVKQEYMSEPETEAARPKKMAQLERRQYDGIGPVTSDGMPIILRSEVKEPHHHEWYKRLYQTIHKQKNGDDYVIRYRCPRGRYQLKTNGYASEPEPNYDSDYSTVKYRTLDCKRLQSTSSPTSHVKTVANHRQGDIGYGTMQNPIKAEQSSYKNQPGRIEDYVTGHSSVSDKEKKEWWDEVMDIFSGQHLDQSYYTEGNLSRALAKESGYASDSNLLLRRKEDTLTNPLSPVEQKQAYKTVQAGGEPPFFGFRKTAPEKRKAPDAVPIAQPQPPRKGVPLNKDGCTQESPSRYVESNVNIHYKTPIRYENKELIPENELATRQAQQMHKLYQEERRRKYLQELQDMNARRHTDNFTPSQKSPIHLNRYDDFQSDLAPKSPNAAMNLKIISRALYNFQGQTARELTFRKGDVIYIRRQIDKNWYEGEHNAMVGLLPSNYVEIISTDGVRQPARSCCPTVGQARAKYNFHAQSGIELSLNKGELVTLTRRVDANWFEGKIANRKGIFPVSYVEVINDISCEDPSTPKAIVSSSSNTTSLHPSIDTQRPIVSSAFNAIPHNDQQPPNGIRRETRNIHKTDMLHVNTSTDSKIYRAIYKYRPQNSDELELQEGDIVHVLEKCDDGWFVGTSQRTSCFGTFPGNYVERA